jgi:hypothetical protein
VGAPSFAFFAKEPALSEVERWEIQSLAPEILETKSSKAAHSDVAPGCYWFMSCLASSCLTNPSR